MIFSFKNITLFLSIFLFSSLFNLTFADEKHTQTEKKEELSSLREKEKDVIKSRGKTKLEKKKKLSLLRKKERKLVDDILQMALNENEAKSCLKLYDTFNTTGCRDILEKKALEELAGFSIRAGLAFTFTEIDFSRKSDTTVTNNQGTSTESAGTVLGEFESAWRLRPYLSVSLKESFFKGSNWGV
jgi:hypothetical protein